MMTRLYYGELLRMIRYYPAGYSHEGEPLFMVQLGGYADPLQTFRDSTVNGIIKQIKTAGYQVWGGDHPMDYTDPKNALEYELLLRIPETAKGKS